MFFNELTNTKKVYRNTLTFYWIAIFLTVVLEYMLHSTEESFLNKLIMQAIFLVVVVGVMEVLYRYRNVQNDWLLTLTSILFVTSIFMVNPYEPIMPALYIFPILTAVLYYNKNRIIVTYILVLAAFGTVYMLSPQIRIALTIQHVIEVIFLYSAVMVVALTITINGRELLINLRKATLAKQDLLVKTIVMDKISKMDALTDLYNHKTFHEYLERLIEYNEHKGLPLQLAIIDIDNFKLINDTYGHWVGDIILIRVANIIKETFTANDFVARYGGEEFAVIFTEKTIEESLKLVEQMRQRLSQAVHAELDSHCVTVSIGIYSYEKGEGKEGLFKGADAALYMAKRSGKNQTVVHRKEDTAVHERKR